MPKHDAPYLWRGQPCLILDHLKHERVRIELQTSTRGKKIVPAREVRPNPLRRGNL